MKYVSLFSGIEAASVAWDGLGWEPLCFAEFDEFPSAFRVSLTIGRRSGTRESPQRTAQTAPGTRRSGTAWRFP